MLQVCECVLKPVFLFVCLTSCHSGAHIYFEGALLSTAMSTTAPQFTDRGRTCMFLMELHFSHLNRIYWFFSLRGKKLTCFPFKRFYELLSLAYNLVAGSSKILWWGGAINCIMCWWIEADRSYLLRAIADSESCQNIISVQHVCLTNVTSPATIIHQYLQLRLLSWGSFFLFTFAPVKQKRMRDKSDS